MIGGCDGRAPLLGTVSRTALALLLLDLALGVVLPSEACAGSGSANPVQTSTYLLGTFNPITFEAATQINAADVGVYGGLSNSWTVANYGSHPGIAPRDPSRIVGKHSNQLGRDRRNGGYRRRRPPPERRRGHQSAQWVDQRVPRRLRRRSLRHSHECRLDHRSWDRGLCGLRLRQQ